MGGVKARGGFGCARASCSRPQQGIFLASRRALARSLRRQRGRADPPCCCLTASRPSDQPLSSRTSSSSPQDGALLFLLLCLRLLLLRGWQSESMPRPVGAVSRP